MINTFDSQGYDYLGSTKMTAQAQASAVVQIPPRDLLTIIVLIAGVTSSDNAALVFNEDEGSFVFNSRELGNAAGGTTWANSQGAGRSTMALTFNGASPGQLGIYQVSNAAGRSKCCKGRHQQLTGSAATVGRIALNSHEWVNTSVQITQVKLISINTELLVGSGFFVLGRNM